MAVRSAPRICVELGLYAKSFKRLNVVVTAHRCLRRRAPLCASFPKFLVASICDLPDVIDCQFREFVAALFGTRAFSVAGSTVSNSLPDHLRVPAVDSEQFRQDLKTYLFAGHSIR